MSMKNDLGKISLHGLPVPMGDRSRELNPIFSLKSEHSLLQIHLNAKYLNIAKSHQIIVKMLFYRGTMLLWFTSTTNKST